MPYVAASPRARRRDNEDRLWRREASHVADGTIDGAKATADKPSNATAVRAETRTAATDNKLSIASDPEVEVECSVCCLVVGLVANQN